VERTILRKRNSDGQSIDVRLRETSPGVFALQVFVDGYFVAGPATPMALDEPKGNITHYLGGGYGDRPIIGLTQVEAEMVRRALERAQRDSGSLQPSLRRALEARRRELTQEYCRLMQRRDAEYQEAKAAGRDDAEQVRLSYEARMASTQQAIVEFDRQHPDIAGGALTDPPGDTE